MTRLWQALLADSGENRLGRRGFVALLLFAIIAISPGIFSIPAMDRDEARYAQATKQMHETGDYVDIRFADQVRYLQPAGIYWLQAVASAPFGGKDAPIGAFRLPSLLSAISVVLLTAWFGARLFGAGVGLAAGFVLSSCLMLVTEAHFAKIDSTLLFVTLAAQVALYHCVARSGAGRLRFIGWPLLFWGALGVGGMLKGPIILMVVGFTALVFTALRRAPGLLLRLRPLLGVPIVVALVAPWVVAISIQTDGLFLQEAVGYSFADKITSGQQAHGGPVGYHLMIFGLTFFPGVLLAGLGGFYAWRNRADVRVQFLLSWAIPTWLVFEIVATKLPHYTLPAFPALALLVASGLMGAAELMKSKAARVAHMATGGLFFLVAVALVALPFVAAGEFDAPFGPLTILASAFAVAVVLAGVWLWIKPEPARYLAVAFAMAGIYITMFQFVVPGFERMWVSRALAAQVHALEGCPERAIATAGFSEPSAVFQFGSQTKLLTGDEAAGHLAANPACGLALVESAQQEAFDAARVNAGFNTQNLGVVSGRNYVNGRNVSITIWVAQGSDISAR